MVVKQNKTQLLSLISASTRPSHVSSYNIPSNSQPFAQVQASGYSPALQRKRNGSFPPNRKPNGWMTEPTATSAGVVIKERDFGASHEAVFQHHRHPAANAPQSILVKPDGHKNGTDKVKPDSCLLLFPSLW